MHKTHIWKQRKDVSKVQGQDNDVNFQGAVLYPLTRTEEQRVKTANSIYAFRRNTHWWDKPRSRSAVEDAWYCEQKAVKQLLHFNPYDVCQEFAEKSGTMWYWEGWAPKEVSRIIIPGESASSCQSTNQQAEVEKCSVFRKLATRHKEGTLVRAGWGHQVRTREKNQDLLPLMRDSVQIRTMEGHKRSG